MENQQLPPPPPVQPLNPQDERTWAMLAHLLALTGAGFIAPLIIWLIYKDRSAYVSYHAKESLNFQITIIIAGFVCFLLMIVLVGLLLIWVVGIGALVLTVVAGVKANNGEYYRYPLTIRFIS
nr:DUF4870 domain-containing protein [uncultured Arsenicibacter sp.]